jgi:hypothetical protein
MDSLGMEEKIFKHESGNVRIGDRTSEASAQGLVDGHDTRKVTSIFDGVALSPGELLEKAGEDTPWVVPGLLARGGVTDVHGPAKRGGKTTFTMGMVKSILEGAPFLGRPTEKTGVVYLTEQGGNFSKPISDFGLDRSEHARDLYIIQRNMTKGLKWRQIADEAINLCLVKGAGVFIVDTLPTYSGLKHDQENLQGYVKEVLEPVVEAAQEHDLAIWLVRHSNKMGEGRGSVQFEHDVDILLSLKPPGATMDKNVRILDGIGRYDGIPEGLHVALKDGSYVAQGSSAAVKRDGAKDLVLEVLAEHEERPFFDSKTGKPQKMTKDFLAEEVRRRLQAEGEDVGANTVKRTIPELVREKKIEELGGKLIDGVLKGVKNHPIYYAILRPEDLGIGPLIREVTSENPEEDPWGDPEESELENRSAHAIEELMGGNKRKEEKGEEWEGEEIDSTHVLGVGGGDLGGNGEETLEASSDDVSEDLRNRTQDGNLDASGFSPWASNENPEVDLKDGNPDAPDDAPRENQTSAWNEGVVFERIDDDMFDGDLLEGAGAPPAEAPMGTTSGRAWSVLGDEDISDFLSSLDEDEDVEPNAPPNGGIRPRDVELTYAQGLVLESAAEGGTEEQIRRRAKLGRTVWKGPWKDVLRLGLVGPADDDRYEVKPLGQKALEGPRRTRPS